MDDLSRYIVYLSAGIPFLLWALLRPAYSLRASIPWKADAVGVLFTGFYIAIYETAVEDPLRAFLEHAESVAWIHARFAGVPFWLRVMVYLVITDFLAYWTHRLSHTKLLWDTHDWHHSSANVTFLGGMRGSFVHHFLLLLPYTVTFALLPMAGPFWAAVSLSAFLIVNQHYIHSNIRWPFERQLEWIFVTPRFHLVHHFSDRTLQNNNFGFVFSVWDRLFGTYSDPGTVDESGPLGLSRGRETWRMVLGLPGGRKPVSQGFRQPDPSARKSLTPERPGAGSDAPDRSA